MCIVRGRRDVQLDRMRFCERNESNSLSATSTNRVYNIVVRPTQRGICGVHVGIPVFFTMCVRAALRARLGESVMLHGSNTTDQRDATRTLNRHIFSLVFRCVSRPSLVNETHEKHIYRKPNQKSNCPRKRTGKEKKK